MTARVLLAGAHGHGRVHRENLDRLAAAGVAELVGVCDPVPVPGPLPHSASLPELIDAVDPDVVLIATPIHTHVDLALTAVAAGRAVLLEKPPAPSLAEYRRLLAAVNFTGVPCQVGFQSLGSAAVGAARDLIAAGRIGSVEGIGGAGTWVRRAGYYARAHWAGRRRLGDIPVVDGALTNPFAHLVATALALDPGDPAGIGVELFHANDIEADDTASLRLHTATGIPVTIAVTLCAAEHREPYLVVHGSRGRLVLHYTRDVVELTTGAGVRRDHHDRVDLLTDLIGHLRFPARPLLVPLASTGGFMHVLDAVRQAPEPVAIPSEYLLASGHGADARRTVAGIDDAVLAAAETLRTFREQGLVWA